MLHVVTDDGAATFLDERRTVVATDKEDAMTWGSLGVGCMM